MNTLSRKYENSIKLRNSDCGFMWASRKINPQIAFQQRSPRPTPNLHKEKVLNSRKIQALLENISKKENISKSKLEEQVKTILDEIGYNKSLKVIRWLALILINICSRISSGIYVNIDNLLQIKLEMGDCPVVFVPSHRSYADFILMSFICFAYDIEIPAIAAGMDFHGMWGMGSILRDTGAFFMRRSYNDDGLYWAAFKQYIYQLVTKGDLPIEFFIEGTRSRSNKSLVPKYGLISMILKPWFFSEVPDIKFVPINISYDRILEETLFSFELLGVPKPKETTSSFFKSLKIVKESYGKVYFHFGDPISTKSFFGDKLNKSVHSMAPLHTQEVTEEEKRLTSSLAREIVYRQQKCGVLTVFNLISLVLNNNLVTCSEPLTVEQLMEQVIWIRETLIKLGAFVFTTDLRKSIDECFVVHKNLIELKSDYRIGLVQNSIVLDNVSSSKLKAHALSEKCMTASMPFVMLQLYINPSLHYFIDVALIVIILKTHMELGIEQLFNTYHFLRSLFSVEFITTLSWLKTEFEKGLQVSQNLNLVKHTVTNTFKLGDNTKLQDFLFIMFKPFMMSYFVTLVVLDRCEAIVDEKSILVNVQKILENKMINKDDVVHPYSLNLDTLTNCINALIFLGALGKTGNLNTRTYEVKRDQISIIGGKLGKYVPSCCIEDILVKQLYIQNKL